jgi:rRNA-processing protein FCF1
MRELILDTNFLLTPFQFKVDVFTELDHIIEGPYQMVSSTQVLRELKKISRNTGRSGAAARFALKLLEANKERIKIIKSDKPVDDWVVEHSKEKKAIVATNDIKLKKRLKKYGIKVMGLRTKTKLGYV